MVRINRFSFLCRKNESNVLYEVPLQQIQSDAVLNNARIKFVDSIKFLGLTIDKQLNWRKHARRIKLECMQRLNIMKSLGYHRWGAHRESLLRIYQVLIRSKMAFGCMVYGSAKQSILKQLEPIQNSAIRIATGAFRTSPANSLHCESSQLPLKYRRNSLSTTYVANLVTNPNIPTFSNIFQTQQGVTNFRHPNNNNLFVQRCFSDLNLQVPNLCRKTNYLNSTYPSRSLTKTTLALAHTFSYTAKSYNNITTT